MKITTYTALCGKRDDFQGNVDVAFRDADGTAPDIFKSNLLNAKMPKILSHLYLPNTEASLWMDANVSLLVPVMKLLPLLADCDVAAFRHPERSTVPEELFASFWDKRYNRELMREQVKTYRESKLPDALFECGVLLRKHTPQIKRANERWWAEICRWSPQDQLSFPAAFDGVAIKVIPGSIRGNDSGYFRYDLHTHHHG